MPDPDKILPAKCNNCHSVIRIDGECYKCQKKLNWKLTSPDTNWQDVTNVYDNCFDCLFPSIYYEECLGWEDQLVITYDWPNECCDLDTQTEFDGVSVGWDCGPYFPAGAYIEFTSGDDTSCGGIETITVFARNYFNDNPGETSKTINLYACWFAGNSGCNGDFVGDIVVRVVTGIDTLEIIKNVAATNNSCCQNNIGSITVFKNGSLEIN